MIIKALKGTETPDNLRVERDETPVLIQRRVIKKGPVYTESVIYDTNKGKWYEAMQNFYNNNFFGYGLFGNQTHLNPITQQEQIESNYDYAKSNLYNFVTNLLLQGIFGRYLGLIPKTSREETIEAYLPYQIGGGAESMAFENTPALIGKISVIPVEEMEIKNSMPYAIPSTFRGTVEDMNIYTLPKLRVPKNISKHIKKLDNMMRKRGFTVEGGGTPTHSYVAPDAEYVIDDVGAGNIGIDWLGRPRMIDFSVLDYPSWLEIVQ